MKKIKGSCHCQKIAFEAQTEITEALSCNCSICQKKGSLLAFLPASQFTLLKGQEYLSDYQFGNKTIHHLFCKNCGVSAFGSGKAPDGTDIRAINVRCVDDIDLGKLKINHYNGKDL